VTSALFHEATSPTALWAAALRASRGKRHRPSVARTLLGLEGVVLRLHDALRAGVWRPGRPSLHVIQDPKRRTITAAPFEDRIVHQALAAAIGPLLDRHLIARSYACRVRFGTHAALRQARVWARRYRHFVHLDVRKFFPSVDHAILLAQLARDLACPDTLALCDHILHAGTLHLTPARFRFPGDDLFAPFTRVIGLPIGHLTSQHFANRYLSPVDHRATDRLRVRGYLRYMDDMLVFGDDPRHVRDVAAELEQACHRQRLRLHPWQVMPTHAGVSFVGYRITPDQIRVRRTSVARAQRRLARLAAFASREQLAASLRATFAHWSHADTYRLRADTLAALGLLHGIEDDDRS
jgi:hypothetical protein